MVSRDKLEDHLKKHSLVLVTAAVFILLLWAYLCLGYREQFYIFRHLFTGSNPFSDKVVAYGPLARLFCYTVTLLTGASVLILTPWKRIPWFTLMGTRTLNVYFWHQIFVFHLFKRCHLADLFHKGIFGKAAYFLVAVLMSIVLSSVKCFDYPMKIIKEKCFHPQKDGNES